MRVVGDLATPANILQVEKTPEVDEFKPFNGRFIVPVPDGAALDVTSDSYILPQDSGSVPVQAAQALLAQFPMYDHIVWNFLLEALDVAELDLTATGPAGEITRAQVGRGSGPNSGTAPNSCMVPPTNLSSGAPGCLVTDTIDIGPVTGGAGADEFLVWWHIASWNTTDDIASNFGTFNGANQPAQRELAEVDQEPGFFDVYISHDDGASWTGPLGRLEPTDLVSFGTLVRLAFLNTSASNRAYVIAYSVMF